MRNRYITITSTDRDRLLRLVDSARLDWRVSTANLVDLEHELARAKVVEPEELPDDVVAMNSTVWFRDLENDEIENYTLTYPPEADVIQNRISVFAPIGTALLGYRRGDIIEWKVPSGRRRIEIIKVTPWKAAEHVETAEAAA